MLTEQQIDAIAAELAEADRAHAVIPRITARYPDGHGRRLVPHPGPLARYAARAGRTLVGRKIGLTSKAMQQATGITEPDYGVMFDDTVYRSGDEIPVALFSNVRIEVELAFVLKTRSRDPTARWMTPSPRSTTPSPPRGAQLDIELEGRTIVDTISDNAAYGAMVLGDVHKRPTRSTCGGCPAC